MVIRGRSPESPDPWPRNSIRKMVAASAVMDISEPWQCEKTTCVYLHDFTCMRIYIYRIYLYIYIYIYLYKSNRGTNQAPTKRRKPNPVNPAWNNQQVRTLFSALEPWHRVHTNYTQVVVRVDLVLPSNLWLHYILNASKYEVLLYINGNSYFEL